MPSVFDIQKIWKNVREIDLRPIREEAERFTRIAIVGNDAAEVKILAEILRRDLRKTLPPMDASRSTPEPILASLDDTANADAADLIILLANPIEGDSSRERALFQRWLEAGNRVIVVNNGMHGARHWRSTDGTTWREQQILRGSLHDAEFIENEFVPAVLDLMPDAQLSLARQYPLFRMRVARQLIADTSTTNASYAFSTGLAEIIPLLDVPFNVADMVILTKAQALMAYKLGLAFGLSTRWQDHLAAFGGTIGGGFIWRSLARGLVGLIPVWGIIPKTAVAYAGTYALGQGIVQWYLTGREITPEMMRGFYKEALERGKAIARTLLERAPKGKRRLRLPRRTKRVET